MIYENYLGHKLKHYTINYYNYDYKCEKCGVVIYYNDDNNFNKMNYHEVKNKGIADELFLTCDEYIIKQIIE